jgi:tetratricopeptide (TPR) repeat protein
MPEPKSVPNASLAPEDPPPSVGLLHAAAAVAASQGATGVVDRPNVVGQFFVVEARRWRESADRAGLARLPSDVLAQAVLVGALVGAADQTTAQKVLTEVTTRAGGTAPDRIAGMLADWLRGPYPTREPDWLAPHLPAVLLERYATDTIIATPALSARLVAATRDDDARARHLLTVLARATAHGPYAVAATAAVIGEEPYRMIRHAIAVADATGLLLLDTAIATALAHDPDGLSPTERLQLYESVPEIDRRHLLANAATILLRSYLADPSIEPEHRETLSTRHDLASLLKDQGRYADAETELRAVLAIQERVLSDGHLDTIAARHDLAGVLKDQGRYADAETELRAVLAIRERVLGDDHLDTIATLNSLAGVLMDQGRYADAETELRSALANAERVLGPEHCHILTTRNNVVQVLEVQGRYSEAEDSTEGCSPSRNVSSAQNTPTPSAPATTSPMCWTIRDGTRRPNTSTGRCWPSAELRIVWFFTVIDRSARLDLLTRDGRDSENRERERRPKIPREDLHQFERIQRSAVPAPRCSPSVMA